MTASGHTPWSEFEDELAEVISDSIDMDWTSSDGARAVIRWLNENAPASADVAVLKAQRDDLAAAAEPVLAISDRKHDAWDALKAALSKARGGEGHD